MQLSPLPARVRQHTTIQAQITPTLGWATTQAAGGKYGPLGPPHFSTTHIQIQAQQINRTCVAAAWPHPPVATVLVFTHPGHATECVHPTRT